MDTISLNATLDSLEKALDFITVHAKDIGFSGITLNRIRLASEEIIVNVITYAYPESTGVFTISCERQTDQYGISIKIVDSGIEFNPISIIPPAILNMPLEKRPIGGLGIHLVSTIMDRISYKRSNGLNELTMVKLI